MVGLSCRILVGVVALVLGTSVFAEEVTRKEAQELMEECQRQRQINIAPLREQEVEKCIINRRLARSYCEAHYKNYGEGSHRMFWGLPVCEQAVAAERYFGMNPRYKVFKLP